MPDNVATMRRFYDEVFGAGNVDALGELLTDDFVEHEGQEVSGADAHETLRGFVATMKSAFPDFAVRVDDVFEAGDDRVVARIALTGTHEADYEGVPASGNRIEVEAIDIVRFAPDGRAAEHWGVTDVMSMMQQIGAMAARPSA